MPVKGTGRRGFPTISAFRPLADGEGTPRQASVFFYQPLSGPASKPSRRTFYVAFRSGDSLMDEQRRTQDANAIIGELGWPSGISTERLVASVFDRAMQAGMFESELILGYAFDRAEFPAAARENRLAAALNALCRFAADHSRLEELRYAGRLVSDEVLRSDGWTSASPRLPDMHCLYEASRGRHRARSGAPAESPARKSVPR